MDFGKSNRFESQKGTIGNLLTIIAIRRNRQMHTTFNGKPSSLPMNLTVKDHNCSVFQNVTLVISGSFFDQNRK